MERWPLFGLYLPAATHQVVDSVRAVVRGVHDVAVLYVGKDFIVGLCVCVWGGGGGGCGGGEIKVCVGGGEKGVCVGGGGDYKMNARSYNQGF